MMSTTFCEAVVNEVRAILGEGYTVVYGEVPKNNCVLSGISIIREGESVSPTIYLESFHENDNVVHVANKVIKVYRANVDSPEAVEARKAADALNHLNSWQYVKDKLRVRLFNRKTNDKFFENLVCREWLDLMAVLYIQLNIGTANVNTVLFSKWNVSEEEVFAVAYENMKNDCEIADMSDPYALLCGDEEALETFSLFDANVELPTKPGMYALSNKKKNFGAGCILLPDALHRFGRGKDVVILPSSVHECLLFRADDVQNGALGDMSYSDLSEMITAINATKVAPKDILSDHPYLYVAAEGKIMCVS